MVLFVRACSGSGILLSGAMQTHLLPTWLARVQPDIDPPFIIPAII